MKQCLILCQNSALATSLQLWLVQAEHVEEQLISVKILGTAPDSTGITRIFEGLTDWIESELKDGTSSSGVLELITLTDLCGYGEVRPNDLNPTEAQGGWSAVLGMLVFSFPEIHWIFASGTPSSKWNENLAHNNSALKELHFAGSPEKLKAALETVSHKRLSPLCDSTGLRDAIRRTIDGKRVGVELPCRTDLAIAVDEERSYAWLHAYTAYRFGFRSLAVTTYGGMQWVFREKNLKANLVFEDYFLQFGDGHPEGFSNLRNRDKQLDRDEHLDEDKKSDGVKLKGLAKVDNRILVTSGHHRGQDHIARIDNPLYLRELRASGKWNCEINKPLGGIFNLWKDSGLQRRLREGGRRGLARKFDWPKKPVEGETGHSTPGRLLVIADRLIARAERLQSGVQSVPHAVHGALLATDAIELLGGKTPTTSLEALALKHYFEALAECQFVGTQQHMDVNARIKDIQREVDALSIWFGAKRKQRVAAAWNAELSILNKLIKVFRDHNQFDEEQMLMRRARALHRKLRFVNYPVIAKPLEVFPWYVEKLVTSFPLFIVAIALWIVILGGLYSLASGVGWDQGLADAYTAFLGIGPPSDEKLWKPSDGWNGAFWLVALTLGLGFVHLGIFISHLYSIISRK